MNNIQENQVCLFIYIINFAVHVVLENNGNGKQGLSSFNFFLGISLLESSLHLLMFHYFLLYRKLLLSTGRTLLRKSYGVILKEDIHGTINQMVLLHTSKSVGVPTLMQSPSKVLMEMAIGPNSVALPEERSLP